MGGWPYRLCWWISRRYLCYPLESYRPSLSSLLLVLTLYRHIHLTVIFSLSLVFVNICSPPTHQHLLVGHLYARFAHELNLTCYSLLCQRNKSRIHRKLPLPVDETSYSIGRDERLILFDRITRVICLRQIQGEI